VKEFQASPLHVPLSNAIHCRKRAGYKASALNALTPKHNGILSLKRSTGYCDVPRGTSAEDLADIP